MSNKPLIERLSNSQKQEIIELYNGGSTQAEIGRVFSLPRRSVMKVCKVLGLTRTLNESGRLKNASPLDSVETIKQIRTLRATCSLREISAKLDSSVSAIQRICKKHNILPPPNHSELQSVRISDSWTEEKKIQCSIDSKARMTLGVRAKISENSKRKWTEKEYKEKQAIGRAQIPRVSGIQDLLYSFLDDLGVKYYREYRNRDNDLETVIGFYSFDCVIPRENQKDLLIECNGDYWHSQEKAIRNDKSKSTYIAKYFADKYELKYLWEHEFLVQDRIRGLLKRWLGLAERELFDFDFRDCVVVEKPDRNQVKLLLSKYHYLPFVSKGGFIFGLTFNDILIGCCVFSPLIRQNVRTDGFERTKCLELSRFCLHPNYQKKNLGSWFISRCVKKLPDRFRMIISYTDTTYNHDGALYKALNFTEDGKIPSDYWYVDKDGFVMGKRKLYKHACKMSMKESEFAVLNGYKKVFGDQKIRFIFVR